MDFRHVQLAPANNGATSVLTKLVPWFSSKRLIEYLRQLKRSVAHVVEIDLAQSAVK
jgi:hypothetical protein